MATDARRPGDPQRRRVRGLCARQGALQCGQGRAIRTARRGQFRGCDCRRSQLRLGPCGLVAGPRSIAASSAQASELDAPLWPRSPKPSGRYDLAPTLPQGQLALGYAKFAGFLDVRGARPCYDKAYRYGRGDADIVLLYAVYTARTGHFRDARDAIDRGACFDPLNARHIPRRRGHRLCITPLSRSDRTRPASARAQSENVRCQRHHRRQPDAGQASDARAAYMKEPSAMFRLRGLAVLEHRAGNQPAADRALAQLVGEVGDAAMYQQAEVMAQWGKADEAMARLQRAREIGDSGLSLIATDPCSTRLRRTRDLFGSSRIWASSEPTIQCSRFMTLCAAHSEECHQ